MAVALSLALGAPALADDPAPAPAAPSKDDLAKAKQAFEEGNALYKEGKLQEAVDKLKESYRLSRNAFLLYNIGHTYDQLGQKDMVLFYYRKFLAGAPANAPMRANVEKRVAALEAENVQAATGEPDDAVATAPQPPPSKYSPNDFKHEQIFTVPPGNPVDVTARVPQDSGLTVKLYYRAAGEASFIAKPMTWRNIELVARIPAAKVAGNNVQYYLEVRDPEGKLVTRSGKSTSPHLVNIERGAKPTYYADFVDEGGEVFVPVMVEEAPVGPEGPRDSGGGGALRAAKWATTGVAAGLLGTSLVTFMLAGQQHDKLLRDANDCGVPPCKKFDEEFGQKVEDLGMRYETIHKVTLGIGIAATAAAGFLWYRDLRSGRREAPAVTVVPVVEDGFTGATAAARF